MPPQTIDIERCTQCGLCTHICASRIYVQTEAGAITLDPALAGTCLACGHCVAACPPGALSVTGVVADAPDLPSSVASADDLMALMMRRRSIRSFTDQPVPRDLLQRIVGAAASAPMSFPPTVIEVTVLTERAQVAPIAPVAMVQLEQLAKMMKTGFGRLMLRLMAGKQTAKLLQDFLMPLAAPWLGKWRESQADMITWDAPALLIFHSAGDSPVGATDATIASTQAMLMAEALDLGSIMLGFASAAIERDKGLRERYGIPPGNRIWNTLAVGYSNYRFRRIIPRDLKSVSWV